MAQRLLLIAPTAAIEVTRGLPCVVKGTRRADRGAKRGCTGRHILRHVVAGALVAMEDQLRGAGEGIGVKGGRHGPRKRLSDLAHAAFVAARAHAWDAQYKGGP